MATNVGRGRTNVSAIKWIGVDAVMRKLNEQTAKIKGKTRKGMTIVVLKIRRDSQKITPVDTGNLRASAYTIVGGGIKRPSVNKSRASFVTKDKSGMRVAAEHQSVIDANTSPQFGVYGIVGYTAHYALKVHEDLKAAGRRIRRSSIKLGFGGKKKSIPDAQIGQAKFLEEAIRKNRKFIITTLQETAFK